MIGIPEVLTGGVLIVLLGALAFIVVGVAVLLRRSHGGPRTPADE